MRTRFRQTARRLRLEDERGLSLVELLVGMVVSLAILAATLQMVVIGMHKQVAVQTRVTQLAQAQLGVARIERQLRQATKVTLTSATALSFTEPVSTGVNESVALSCSTTTGNCSETIAGSSQTVVSGIANSDNFTASPSNSSPDYIGIKLVIAAAGHSNATIADGVGLRNVTLGT
jgi:Tfp pilus assembly protein PilW